MLKESQNAVSAPSALQSSPPRTVVQIAAVGHLTDQIHTADGERKVRKGILLNVVRDRMDLPAERAPRLRHQKGHGGQLHFILIGQYRPAVLHVNGKGHACDNLFFLLKLEVGHSISVLKCNGHMVVRVLLFLPGSLRGQGPVGVHGIKGSAAVVVFRKLRHRQVPPVGGQLSQLGKKQLESCNHQTGSAPQGKPSLSFIPQDQQGLLLPVKGLSPQAGIAAGPHAHHVHHRKVQAHPPPQNLLGAGHGLLIGQSSILIISNPQAHDPFARSGPQA